MVITLIACTNPSYDNNFNLDGLEIELAGTLINDTLISSQKQITKDNSKIKIFYKTSNNKINEVDIHINSIQDSTFPILVNYYNQKFNSNKNDSIFNSWYTDSSEFILYKNSDSSILVNIFKRTYL
jgi:hypothetical protein